MKLECLLSQTHLWFNFR